MKVLVLGYSVTAEEPGFVELASGSAELRGHQISKLGLGGFQPSAAVYLFHSEIEAFQPDLVILEQSTPAFRLYDLNPTSYKNWVLSLLRCCQKQGARFCFLELPRQDVDFADDWVVNLHGEFCVRYGLSQVIVPQQLDLLRDEVHPTEAGREYYAAYFIEAVKKAQPVQATEEDFKDVSRYAAVPLAGLSGSKVLPFGRGGFHSDFVELETGQPFGVRFDRPVKVRGFIGMMGPKTGKLLISVNNSDSVVQMYDQFSYYNRPAGMLLYKHSEVDKNYCRSLGFEQLSGVPDTDLLKGENNYSPRTGYVSHILIEGEHNFNMVQKENMTTYSSHGRNVFARGFIAFRTSSEFSGRILSSSISGYLDGWKKTYFGPYQIWCDEKLNYATARDDQYGVALIGLCINPFDGASSNQEISENLYAALKDDKERFFDYVDQLSGSFVIFYRLGGKVRILQDCAATKPVYYLKDRAHGVIVASHANLIAKTVGLPLDERAQYVFQSDIYKKDPSRYLPGMITPYKNLDPLTANTELLLERGEVRRFFPREPLKARSFDDELVSEVAHIMAEQARILAASGRSLVVATTARRDSRVSVSAFAKHTNTKFFSFHFSDTGHLSEDVETAKALVAKIGRELQIYDLRQYNTGDFQKDFLLNSPMGIWGAAALCYIREFDPEAIHIRSTVSEIGRVFYGRRSAKEVRPEFLAATYTVTDFGADPVVVDAMKDFVDRTSFSQELFFNYDLHDMFYWEHRNSKWQNVLCQEAEMATDVFIPFNNRNLIKIFLSLPEDQRKAALLHVAVTNKMCPEVSGVPYIS